MIGYVLPGVGLGLTGSKRLAFGLGIIAALKKEKPPTYYGSGRYDRDLERRRLKDDEEILTILAAITPLL